MRNSIYCICENKDADCFAVIFVFATRIVQFLFFLYPKFQVSSHLLCLYSSVCVRPVRKPHCWFSHEAVQLSKHNIPCANLVGSVGHSMTAPSSCLGLTGAAGILGNSPSAEKVQYIGLQHLHFNILKTISNPI